MTAPATKAAGAADLGPRQIELLKVVDKYGTRRGAREVTVDGKPWGSIFSFGHGCWGYHYQIMQLGLDGDNLGWVEREAYRDDRDRPVMKPAEFRPKKPSRHEKREGAKEVPLDDQLRGFVAEQISAGRLRDPAEVHAESEAAHERYRLERAAESEAEDAEFQKRAGECLDVLGEGVFEEHVGGNVRAEVIARIVAAMRWAQGK